MMFHRLKVAHPEANEDSLRDAIEAASGLRREAYKPLMEADFSGLRFVARLREECPGFEEKTYETAYHDHRVAFR